MGVTSLQYYPADILRQKKKNENDEVKCPVVMRP